MKHDKLTRRSAAARNEAMQDGFFMRQARRFDFGWRAARAVLLVAVVGTTSGCISVNAPDKPIVIELNINIKQEVVYRLAADAGNTIDANPGLF